MSAGIGEVPVILAQDQLRQGTMISVLGAWSLPTVDISLIYPKRRLLAPRVKALRDYLRINIRPHHEAVKP
jgi:DNA-binding transcriptional LysR family regulator